MAAFRGPKHGWPLVLTLLFWIASQRAGVFLPTRPPERRAPAKTPFARAQHLRAHSLAPINSRSLLILAPPPDLRYGSVIFIMGIENLRHGGVHEWDLLRVNPDVKKKSKSGVEIG
jgi:hypothetical protein